MSQNILAALLGASGLAKRSLREVQGMQMARATLLLPTSTVLFLLALL